jgi:hypothetical protein
MIFRITAIVSAVLMILLVGYGLAGAQMVSFGFDNGVLTADKSEVLLDVTRFQISSGSVATSSVSTSSLPRPPFVSVGTWTATEREAAKHFFFEMTVPDGFKVEIDRITFLAEATQAGPSAVGLSVGSIELPAEDISDLQVLSLDYDLTAQAISGMSVRVEIRGWRNGSRETSGTGVFRVDDILVYGRVTSTSDGPQRPYLLNPSVGNLGTSSAVISSVIGFDGGEEITGAGIILALADLQGVFEIGEPGVSTFPVAQITQNYTIELSGLHQSTRYQVRSYAVNNQGTGYSAPLFFSTNMGFDGSGYYHSFHAETFREAITPEWSVSDTTVVGAFGSATTGGLRWSSGVLGYQHTTSTSPFMAQLALQNTTGDVLDELMISYHGRSVVNNGFRYPSWTVSVNDEQIPALGYSTVDSLGRFGIQYHLTNLDLAPDSVIQIRWQVSRVTTGSGFHRPIGISDVVVAFPTSVEINLTGDAGWRMFSSPVWYMHTDVVTEMSPLQGFNGDGAARNLYTNYDGSQWLPASADNTLKHPERVSSGDGYILYVYNNNQLGSRPISEGRTIRIDGIAPFFDIDVPVHSNGNRWNLLGNPFSQGFDIRELTGDGDFVPVVQIWQDSPGTSQAGEPADGTWVLSNSSAVNNIIAAGQGFMLQNASANAATRLTFPQSGRVTGGTLLREHQQVEPRIEFQLSTGNANQKKILDLAAQVVFMEDTSEEVYRFHVPKLPSLTGGAQISVLSPELADNSNYIQRLAQLALPVGFGSEAQTWMEVSGGISGSSYVLSWGMMLDIPHHWDLILTDVLTDTQVNLKYEPEYRFTHEDHAVLDTTRPARFQLKIINTHATGIEISELPLVTFLYPNYPNPFNPTTTVQFDLAESGDIKLELFDVLGRHIVTPADGYMQAGRHSVNIGAANWASGVYLYRLTTNNVRMTRKMTLVR